MTERAHRWAAVAVFRLEPDRAAELADAGDFPDDRWAVLTPRMDIADCNAPFEIRGPICLDCRIHWRDVHREGHDPLPCPGERPQALGGPVLAPERRMSRQERRRRERELAKGRT